MATTVGAGTDAVRAGSGEPLSLREWTDLVSMRKILLRLVQGVVATAVAQGDMETLDRLARLTLTTAVHQRMAKELR